MYVNYIIYNEKVCILLYFSRSAAFWDDGITFICRVEEIQKMRPYAAKKIINIY